MNKNDHVSQPDFIKAALENETIPKIYFNGFSNGIGNSDLVLVLLQNGKPNVVLNTSLTTAKTLSLKLNELIGLVEKNSGNQIMTTDEIDVALGNSKQQ